MRICPSIYGEDALSGYTCSTSWMTTTNFDGYRVKSCIRACPCMEHVIGREVFVDAEGKEVEKAKAKVVSKHDKAMNDYRDRLRVDKAYQATLEMMRGFIVGPVKPRDDKPLNWWQTICKALF